MSSMSPKSPMIEICKVNCTDIFISSVCEPVTVNVQICHYHAKSMILNRHCPVQIELVSAFSSDSPVAMPISSGHDIKV
ncbi:hypothetical protein TSAR_016622 [Trichomalopsis sarcophagae]|uniref:Uncharacterized protein n=1 Tax=Trichomalopsis sarcophagae TaxID=543379 RepID=A0A232FEE5_9HYME|nr:hypothetical protein TSAR_016622 [Trichomalopsis sarcophagae]